MNADTISRGKVGDIFPNSLDVPGYFVPKGYRQRIKFRNAGAIMRIGVADPASGHADQNIGRTDFRNGNVGLLQWFAGLRESHSSHGCPKHPGFRNHFNVQRLTKRSLAIVIDA